MFRFDEATLNERFGRGLDNMLPRVVSRGADFPAIGFLAPLRLLKLPLMKLLGHNQEEIGLKIRFSNKFLQQRTEDTIEVIVHQIITRMLLGIMDKCDSIRRPLIVGPLSFEYEVGEVLVGDQIMSGVEVVVVTSIKWNQF